LQVPNVVHYVWLGANRIFTFIHYLSFRGTHKHIAPDYIFIHGDSLPLAGDWWNRTLREVDNIYFVTIELPPHAPNGARFHFFEHATDLVRIATILGETAGILL
jgi:hypothetical protein